ncbi:MAG: hypothetical protein J0J01_13740 [Reyranella sp.]|uniref:hypothetical protein n=1 Tax=Reyranella sp. TaxID=1929291 RepID=UPI001AC9DD6E|nr:hypothetical protein [Reyranella sp.]MBN9087968.1 hypothetical protein [Reyranella sp.]
MKPLVLIMLFTLLAACSDAPPHVISPSAGPDDPASPAANIPYRPVMAGTTYHGIGSKP